MNYIKITLFLVLFSLLGVHPQRTNAEPEVIIQKPKEVISSYARLYGASEVELLAVAKCESNFSQKAIGDHGKAKNIFQYHKSTFEDFSSLLGEKLDYNSYQDQAKLTAFIFAKHPELKKHWTCWKNKT